MAGANAEEPVPQLVSALESVQVMASPAVSSSRRTPSYANSSSWPHARPSARASRRRSAASWSSWQDSFAIGRAPSFWSSHKPCFAGIDMVFASSGVGSRAAPAPGYQRSQRKPRSSCEPWRATTESGARSASAESF
jgi:hypothetical protein